ncbi:hypothetical protein ABID16_003088 [Rhizobium aquaticum]|uniref:Phage terminase large subunit-like protein n=1 Tax=Rhizobium aquaticum TaxID=1549636 RepID=A0ABV2J1X5_9HYPH
MSFDLAALDITPKPIEVHHDQEERDYLIAQVRSGAMTPEMAEGEAVAKKIDPIALLPSFRSFDPLSEPNWTLDMALAWVAWRSAEIVAFHSKPFRDECLGWKPSKRLKYDGAVPQNRRSPFSLMPPEVEEFATLEWLPGRSLWVEDSEQDYFFWQNDTLIPVSVIFAPDGDPNEALGKLADARRIFLAGLKQGDIIASAIDINTGDAVEIPASEWHFLAAFRGEDGYSEFSRRAPDENNPEYCTPKYRWGTVRKVDLSAWLSRLTMPNAAFGMDVGGPIDFDRYLIWCRSLDLTTKKVAMIAWPLWIRNGIKLSALDPAERISAVDEFVVTSEMSDNCHDVTPEAVERFFRAFSGSFPVGQKGENEGSNESAPEQQLHDGRLVPVAAQNGRDDRFPADLLTFRRPRSAEERRRYFGWCESLGRQTALRRVGQLYWKICSGKKQTAIEPRPGILINQLRAGNNPVSESSIKKFRRILAEAINDGNI